GQRAGQAQYCFIEYRLDGGGKVHMTLCDQVVGSARRPAEQCVEALVGHPQTGTIIEVALIEMEAAVGFKIQKMVEDQLRVFRLAIGSKAHDVVFAGIHLKAELVSERRVQQAERMRKVDLTRQGQAIILSKTDRRGSPLPYPVHGEDRRFAEGGGEESRRR